MVYVYVIMQHPFNQYGQSQVLGVYMKEEDADEAERLLEVDLCYWHEVIEVELN
jgi:hypothetical protein